MDWVQTKTKTKKLRSSPPALPRSTADRTGLASEWLDQLCVENIARLKSSLPLGVRRKHGKRRDASPFDPRSLWWGTSTLNLDADGDAQLLLSLLESIEPGSTKLADGDQKNSQVIADWLNEQLPLRGDESLAALIAAGWIHSLSEVGRALEPNIWLETLQAILSQVDRAWGQPSPERILAWMIWTCEVPLALAGQLSQLGSRDRVVSETMDRLALFLEQSSEDPTVWLADGGESIRGLLACAIRCRWSADKLGVRPWYAVQLKALSHLTTLALGLCDRKGKPLLIDEESGKKDCQLWQAIAKVCSPDKRLDQMMRFVLADTRKKDHLSKSGREHRLPKLGQYHEKAELATMRRDWNSHGCRVAVDFSCEPMWLDATGSDGRRILSGPCSLEISKNGRRLELDSGWQEVCWFSDDDADYLELQCGVNSECVVQRQIMLMRDEGVVFLADALLGESEANWQLTSQWALAQDIELELEKKTREGKLVSSSDQASARRVHSLVLPIGAPEWRRQSSAGELSNGGDALIMTQEVKGKRLYSPLILSLRRRQAKLPYTWRNLTIASDLKIQSSDVAVAYRIQIGKEQWFIYRSLDEVNRRTTMGLHLNSEFYAARFDSEDGQFEPLVEVDAATGTD